MNDVSNYSTTRSFARRLSAVLLICFVPLIFSCEQFVQKADFVQEANTKFDDQGFKSTIAHIELHKVRFGVYPDNLDTIKFTGDWDQLWMKTVKYSKLEDGYQLDIVRGEAGKLEYPAAFWQGLGIRKTNVGRTGV